jgi:UDP-N-acetyl-2-amino-2-deoxyglucuronate dehydrogenase
MFLNPFLFVKSNKMANFAIIGCGGHVAPKHLRAIKETDNDLVVAVDKNDSVGILDSYSFDVKFFEEFERFDRHVENLRRKGNDKKVDYVSICSPNYLHDAHVRWALKSGADAICEKPLSINPWNVDALEEFEKRYENRVYNILQLRNHPLLLDLEGKVRESGEKHEVDLTYITPRGNWYHQSWKGDVEKSGGLAMNIGVHFFDMLLWIFGDLKNYEVNYSDPKTISGNLELEKANVKWFLSVNKNDLPEGYFEKRILKGESTSYRSILIDGKEINFTDGFSNLHTETYRKILNGEGLGIRETKPAIDLVYKVRTGDIMTGSDVNIHPFLESKLSGGV